jgi:hypothetical protein
VIAAGYLTMQASSRAEPEAGTLLLSPWFRTREAAEQELEDVLRGEPGWSEKLRVEPFSFRVAKRQDASGLRRATDSPSTRLVRYPKTRRT